MVQIDHQVRYAERLIEQMSITGVELEDEPMHVADLLDMLACAGLKLEPDIGGIAFASYVKVLGGVSGIR